MAESNIDERIIITAPTGQDAAAMARLLNGEGFDTCVCQSVGECTSEIARGAGAMLLTEEALESPQVVTLVELLETQPPWSELPLMILTSGGESRMARVLDLVAEAAGTVTLLERPLSARTMLRSVEVALRSRRRQYQVRDLIQQLAEAEDELRQHASVLEKAVVERTAKLNETVQELEAFSYSIAHDMRAPLRAMRGFSKILDDEYNHCLDDVAKDYLQRIGTSADRLDLLIQDVLNYSHIVRSDIRLSPVNTDTLVRDIIESYPNLQPAHIDIETPLPVVKANPAALTQVFSNLLGNAVKFVAPNVEPQVKIRADSLAQGSAVRLSIKDNGIGIAKESQQRIFQMFQRLNRAELFEGTGIGLTIVRKAVERMGGKIGVESDLGKGSCFWVELQAAGA